MQNNSKPSHLSFTAQRAAGYLLGFALLYAPFELYRRFWKRFKRAAGVFAARFLPAHTHGRNFYRRIF